MSHARNYVYAKIKIKVERTGREKREKIYNKISVYFEEIIIGDQGGAGVYGAQRSRRLGRERTGRQGAHRGVGAAAGRAAAPR